MDLETLIQYYPRMKYGHDQREWVRVAGEQVPLFERDAATSQRQAAEMFAEQDLVRWPWMARMTAETYAEARRNLFRAIHYKAMGLANS